MKILPTPLPFFPRIGARLRLFLGLVALTVGLTTGCDEGDTKSDRTDASDDVLDTSSTDGQEDTEVAVPDATPDTASGCTSDAMCTGFLPNCDVESGQCVACVTSADCGFDAPICGDQNTCLACTASEDCANATFGDICDVDEGVCVGCLSDDDCSGEKPFCDGSIGQCAECRTDFDCSNLNPMCAQEEGTFVCTSTPPCLGDDARDDELSDDGPAGASDVTSEEAAAGVNGALCPQTNAPEADWFSMTIEETSDVRITVEWEGSIADIDLSVYDATGRLLGESWYSTPEEVFLTYLPQGRIFIALTRFDEPSSGAALDYTLKVETTEGAMCETSAECAAAFDSQVFRSFCSPSGDCRFDPAEGTKMAGELCDDAKNCASGICGIGSQAFGSEDGLQITNWFFANYMADAHLKGVCVETCESLGMCGEGTACTTVFGSQNYCAPECVTDDDCPVDLLDPGSEAGWTHLTCENGTCTP